MDPFKNVSVNIKAAGPAAVIIAWLVCVTVVGLFGEGGLAESALTFLGIAGGIILTSLAMRTYQ